MSRLPWCAMAVPALALAGCTASVEPTAEDTKIPITTRSEEARALYVEGRDLVEKLRAADGQERFRRAAELDEGFALAWYGQAQSAQSAREFWDALDKAKTLAPEASEGERRMILALDAGAQSDPARPSAGTPCSTPPGWPWLAATWTRPGPRPRITPPGWR